MKRWGLISFFVLLLVQSGCSSYNINRTKNYLTPKLDMEGSAYVCLGEDGRFNSKVYRGSGMAVTRIIMENLSRYLEKVTKGEDSKSYEEALKAALYGGHTYLFCPSIIQWENHYTEKTETPDKISIKINTIETLTGKQIDSAIISGKSRVITRGGEQPQDLLATPIRIYVDSLFP